MSDSDLIPMRMSALHLPQTETFWVGLSSLRPEDRSQLVLAGPADRMEVVDGCVDGDDPNMVFRSYTTARKAGGAMGCHGGMTRRERLT